MFYSYLKICLNTCSTITINFADKLRSLGYEVVEMWQCEFMRQVESNPELKAFYESYEPYFPINPRDGFFGGRTNAIQLFCEPQDGTEIRYVDFTRYVSYSF